MRRTSIGRLGVVLGFVFAFLLAVPEARADRATEMKAREAFASGRYDDALGSVRQALRGDAAPGLPAQHRALPPEDAPAREGDRQVPRVPREGEEDLRRRAQGDRRLHQGDGGAARGAGAAGHAAAARQPAAAGDADQPATAATAAELLRRAAPAPDDDDLRRRWCRSRRLPQEEARSTRSGGSGPASASSPPSRASWRSTQSTQSGGTTRPPCTASGGCMGP